MAKVIHKNKRQDDTEPPHHPKRAAAMLLLALTAAAFVFFFATRNYAAMIIGCTMLFISLILLLSDLPETPYQSEIKRFGDAGEQATENILSTYLPDTYTVIRNAKIYYEGMSEIDNIVIGPSGVFVIEVKNMKGTVIGDYVQKDWFRYKTDKYGIAHPSYFYSPVRQVGTHVFRLAGLLRENGIDTYVHGAVYFSSPETKLTLKGEKDRISVYVYADTQELIDSILSDGKKLSENKINRIVSLFHSDKAISQ